MPISDDQANHREWLDEQSRQLGFDGLCITDTHLGIATDRLNNWLAEGQHGQMEYMARMHNCVLIQPSWFQVRSESFASP